MIICTAWIPRTVTANMVTAKLEYAKFYLEIFHSQDFSWNFFSGFSLELANIILYFILYIKQGTKFM